MLLTNTGTAGSAGVADRFAGATGTGTGVAGVAEPVEAEPAPGFRLLLALGHYTGVALYSEESTSKG